jgi:uncharacterized membrane protein
MLRFNKVVFGLLAFVATPSMAAKWVYTIQSTQVLLLPDPFLVGGSSDATDINIHGQIVGWADTNGKRNGWLYEPSGVFKNVGEPLTTIETIPKGINNHGEVVGFWTKGVVDRAFYWHPSTGHALLDIELNPGAKYNREYRIRAFAINDFGRIVGAAHAASWSGVPQDTCHAAVPIYWSRPDSSPRVLFCPATISDEPWAVDLNNYGSTVGHVGGGFSPRGFVFKGGAVSDVPWPAGSDLDRQTVNAVNEQGAVAGSASFPGPGADSRPIYWDGTSQSSVSLGALPGGKYAWSTDVNDESFVAGLSDRTLSTEAGLIHVSRAFLWRQEFGLHELPTPPPSGGDSYWQCAANALTNFLPASTTQGAIQVVGSCWQDSRLRAARWDVAVSRIWVP